MAGVGNDLETRVGQPFLPPATVLRRGEWITCAVDEQRLRRNLLRLESPRSEAVAGDVGGEPRRALREGGAKHLTEARPHCVFGEGRLVGGQRREEPERLSRERVQRHDRAQTALELRVRVLWRESAKALEDAPLLRVDPRDPVVGR